ncbi:MAG: GNAT family N-acetyltransferase [Vicinamibacterales bacterium]
MTLDDWRTLGAADLSPAYAQERARWLETLGWDLTSTLDAIEEGRRAGRVAGFVARGDDGTVRGWTYFLTHRRQLQIGALNATTVDVLRGLLDAVLRSPEAESALELMCFAFPERAGLESALIRRRFTVTPYGYLTARVTDVLAGEAVTLPDGFGPWREQAGPALVRLLARAYAGQPSARCFAPHGRLDEWAQYVSGLVHGVACGPQLTKASFVAGESDTEAVGAIITTRVGPGMGHIAQVAVHPDRQRAGWGRQLVRAAAQAAGAVGCHSMSLLVAMDNAPARTLYESLGFAPRAQFVVARRPALRRTLSIDQLPARRAS